jgi:hypothetical protein
MTILVQLTKISAETSINGRSKSQHTQSSYNIERMCQRVMYVLIDEMRTSRPQSRELDKYTTWEGAAAYRESWNMTKS